MVDDLLDLLGLAFVRDQHGVRRLHDDHVVDAETGEQPPLGYRQRVVAADHDHVTLDHISVFVLRQNFP